MVTEQPQYSVVVCIFSTAQNTEISLIPNGLHFIFTYLQLLALAITLHTARHTFASTVTLANNISLIVVSKMLGHSNTRMTEHYAKLVDKCIGEEMDKLMGTFCTKE
ncbi:tyrosine-type recombinase/integrase [Bacteroides uniformis]|nr:tyrosine-type recombinase/integrase [Bacteroides uniformis]MDC1810912.1 tyrosine-type recombinase/integrase [Bacteroides uniformis]